MESEDSLLEKVKNIIEEIDLNAIFPKNIEYPNQNIIKNNITFNSQKNSIKKIEIDKELEINFPKSTSNKEFEIYSIILKGDYLIACGGNYVKIYHIKKSDFTIENEYTIIDKEDENYISLALSIISSDKIILAVGGKNSIIRLIDIIKIEEISRLIGHRNDINDLKFNPTKKNILLSASADMSIRLWNVRKSIQIAIFGGDRCHLAQVLSIDWHISGDYFVSSGVDLRINIWDIRNVENLKICDDITSNNRQDYKIELINKPIYKCRNIHNTQIDSVTFNGNFILSKSSDGVIIEFMPCFNKEKDYFFLINTYIYDMNELNSSMKLYYDQQSNQLFIGNSNGKIFIFDINEKESEKVESDFFFKQNPKYSIDTDLHNNIRCVTYDNNILASGNRTGRIKIYKLKYNSY